jgi:hypothetical protein
MSSNKKVKEALIKKYGRKCFIERLKLRDTTGQRYKSCGQYKRMKQLTYHHIKMKKDGGRATIENGALLSNENHQWFHKQPEESQRIMNQMFQDLKRSIDSQELEVEEVEEVDCPFDIRCTIFEEENGRIQAIMNKSYLKDKARREEKIQMQKIKKEWEDR